MATIAAPTRGEQRVVFQGVSRETYLGLLQARGEGVVRLTYHHGVMEITTLSHLHERLSRFLHRFVVELTQELGLELASAGSTTMHAEQLQSGAEADESYYIRHEEMVREREEYDPAVDPPPDLTIEINLSSISSRRMLVYAELGVPEVWRYDGEHLGFQSLGEDGKYHDIERSRSFPMLRSADLERFLKRWGTIGENALAAEFREWFRQSLPPRGAPGD
ncbi:MAG TPA: Uma2 family endonuclease [Pirellulales bacterium]|nr:Uma2 family endonuclease [Pirellulales bacterium]